MKSREPAAADAATPGATIRALRLDKGLTLAQVSERTGLAISTLSKLEKGHVSLSYDKLMLISKALAVDMASLVDPKAQAPRASGIAAGRRIVHRAGEGQLVETHSYRQSYLATELLNKQMTPIFVELRARTLDEFKAEFGDLIRHPGEEFAWVLEGEVDFHSEVYAPLRLRVGDSVYFDSEMGHAYLKAADGPCRLIATCAPRGHDDAIAQVFASASDRHAEGTTSSPKAAPGARKLTVVRGAAAGAGRAGKG